MMPKLFVRSRSWFSQMEDHAENGKYNILCIEKKTVGVVFFVQKSQHTGGIEKQSVQAAKTLSIPT